jgi:ketosteroid isomerase-like protein
MAWQVASARAVLDQWLAAQLARSFAAYIALYAPDFRGIRRSGPRAVQLDLSGWREDRQRMFGKPMNVWMEDLQAKVVEGGVEVSFRQRWSSGRYTDVGQKRMRLVPQADGKWRILSEEQLTSKVEE